MVFAATANESGVLKMRLIDADALMNQMVKKKAGPADRRYTEGFNDALMRCRSMLHSAPTVDAVPVVHGRWLKDGDFWVCLNCESEINVKNSLGVENHKNYFPNCGAKMDAKDGDS